MVIWLVLAASTSGALVLMLYWAGTATLMIPLTLGLSGSKTLLFSRLKRLVPHVRLMSGAVLMLRGMVVLLSNVCTL